jgi:hypothetical protein
VNLTTALVFLAIAAVASQILKRYLPRTTSKQDALTESAYKAKNALLTPAERTFYGTLKKAVSPGTEVFTKVRLADIVEPVKTPSRSQWQKAFNPIASKHVDFVLCEEHDLKVLCAIELDDRSHGNPKRQERDRFLNLVCESAGVPLLRIQAKRGYVLNELREQIRSQTKAATYRPKESTIAQEQDQLVSRA